MTFQCVTVTNIQTGSGLVQVLSPDSSSPCPSTLYLVDVPAFTSPLYLSAVDGALLSAAVIGVWCIAWAAKALVLTLRNDGEALD